MSFTSIRTHDVNEIHTGPIERWDGDEHREPYYSQNIQFRTDKLENNIEFIVFFSKAVNEKLERERQRDQKVDEIMQAAHLKLVEGN